jgi:hypothetical protein
MAVNQENEKEIKNIKRKQEKVIKKIIKKEKL